MLEVVVRAKTEGKEQHNHQDKKKEIESNVAPASRRGCLVHSGLVLLLLARYGWQRGDRCRSARRWVRGAIGNGRSHCRHGPRTSQRVAIHRARHAMSLE